MREGFNYLANRLADTGGLDHTAEDLCMQLLVLKILYLLFTTKGTSEYFYTNDLCVLVGVFLRELVDLDEDSESVRFIWYISNICRLTCPSASTYLFARFTPPSHKDATS